MTLHGLKSACAILATALLLPACAPLIIGGTAATTAIVATDRRTTGEQVEDQSIELKTQSEMRRLFEGNARVQATAYAGEVLLTGDVPTEAARRQAEEATAAVEKVVRVFNQLRVGEVTPLSTRSRDAWITSKVKTALISTKQVPSRTIVITTERDVVYLMGKVTAAEAERAAIVASSVSGVGKVVKLFEIIPAESLLDASTPGAVPGTGTTPDASASDSGETVEVLPVR